MRRDMLLWTGVLASPVVWSVTFLAKYFLGSWICAFHWKPALFAISAAAFAITACAGLLALRQWQRLGREYPGDAGGAVPRARHGARGHRAQWRIPYRSHRSNAAGIDAGRMRVKPVNAAALAIVAPLLLLAHAGEPIEPHDLWTAWRFDPGAVLLLALSAILYARGARSSRGAAGAQRLCFWTGWATLVVALVSPLHPLGEALFSAHMAQHEILMLIAAPLLVLSRPLAPFVWGLPFEWRRGAGRWSKARPVQRIWRTITKPSAAWCIHALALWAWHVPSLFQATLTNEWVHTTRHFSFLVSALLFWWSLFHAQARGSSGVGVLYVFTTAVHTSILGALLTFASTLCGIPLTATP